MSEIRVRYAPSPTGYQHIGGIRTALFDYLYAKATGGKFILRIEDTDQTRFFDGALEDIYETFKWLGIDYDEGPDKGGEYGPYVQSERTDLYKKYVDELVENGHAYYCFCDAERLEKVRETHQGYDRHCRDLSKDKIEELKKKNPNPVVRIKAPLEGTTFFYDVIFDKIEVDNSTLQDFILMKSDGFPTYHMANIVDDHLMEITHVLRGQEWIPSTPNHIILYNAFGWKPPKYVHLPMVMGEDGKKLSKRHGATQVREYKNAGYLPEAILNFVVLLGWAYNDKDELFTKEKLSQIFSVKKINKSPAVFNFDKLKWFNGHYIRELSKERLFDLVLPLYIKSGLVGENPTDEEKDYIKNILPLIQERMELINDAPEISNFMFGELPEYTTWDEIIPKKSDKTTSLNVLKEAKIILQGLGEKPIDDLKHNVYELTNKLGIKAGAVFMPIRIATTGTNKSPDLFPVLDVLGKEKVLKRMDYAINRLEKE